MSRFDRIFGAFALVGILVFNMWFTHWVDGQSQRRQCEDYANELALYVEVPPDTPARKARFDMLTRKQQENCS